MVAERLAHPEVRQDDGGDAAVQGLQGRRGADRDEQVGAVEDLAHVSVHQTEVGRETVGKPLRQLLVGQLLDVRGVLARLGAQLEQHLAVRVQAGVLDQPVQQVRTVPPPLRYGGLRGEDHRVGPAPPLCGRVVPGVGPPAEEGQRHLGHRRGVGAHSLEHGPETLRVLTGVGEDEVRAVAQQEAVGELLVDDADIAGDDHGPLLVSLPGVPESVQHRLDGAADEGEHDDVVRLPLHMAQELDGGDLAQGVRADADLFELAGGGGGTAPQQEAVEPNVRFIR
uniref:Uncharacterized protein n=1 Tax=Streptomyces avermitilis TaxID=33903 RepID=A0A499VFW3_STRAX|nr:hypothetical protein SAVMC3_38870 [Streptomyces avermitilis]